MTLVELQGRIDKATRQVAQSCAKALKDVEELKKTINDLELSISDKSYRPQGKTSEDLDQLSSAVEMLNELTDSLILGSGRAWDEYTKIEHD